MLWEAPHVVEGLDAAGLGCAPRQGCWCLFPVSQPAAGAVGRVQPCRLHQLQGQLWVSGAGFWVRLLSFMS